MKLRTKSCQILNSGEMSANTCNWIGQKLSRTHSRHSRSACSAGCSFSPMMQLDDAELKRDTGTSLRTQYITHVQYRTDNVQLGDVEESIASQTQPGQLSSGLPRLSPDFLVTRLLSRVGSSEFVLGKLVQVTRSRV